ncbi:MAG: hypothetical protein ACWGQW_01430 [bacterium]
MNEKVAKVGNWVLFAFTAPYGVIVGWGIVLLAIVLFFAHKPKLAPYGTLTAQWRPWWAAKWKYSTTFGRAIIYHPRIADGTPEIIDHRVEKHEMVHVRQVEDRMLLAFLVGLVVFLVTGNWILGLALWVSGGVWQAPNFVTAVLRGGHIYRDTEHERSAYAQVSEQHGKSWLDEHLSKPRTW